MKQTDLLPEYPRTQHLFFKPNAQRADLIASERECQVIFENSNTYFEEKVDAAGCGICLYEDQPIIRNRSTILTKAGPRARTPAKMQFASIFNWFYQNKEKFEKVGDYSVYGEWMYALHGIEYDQLPDMFIAYDLYDYKQHKFLDTGKAREILTNAGFNIPPLLYKGTLPSWEFLDQFMKQLSPFSTTDRREGIYVKVADGNWITHRFKMVRHDFIQGGRWDSRQIIRNKLAN